MSEHERAGSGRPSTEVCDAELAEPASSEPGLAVSGGPGVQQVSEHGRAGSGRSSAEVCVEPAGSEPGRTDLGGHDGIQQVPEHAAARARAAAAGRRRDVLEVGRSRGHVGVQQRGARRAHCRARVGWLGAATDFRSGPLKTLPASKQRTL